MEIIIYRTEMDKRLHTVLVKERSMEYPYSDITNPKAASELLNALYSMNRLAEEHVYMIALSTRGRVLGVFEISHGSKDAAVCSPKDVFVRALLCGATGIIIAHNHPSGDIQPSREDFKVCEKIKNAGKLLEIYLRDSIIIGSEGRYFSFYEEAAL